ncbi:hypothetical protein RQP54_18270 [Curvibacter sp. APW13]|uniref:hypothetical protein n=1 Tax=Curvibacter sp. APW13 TaxID=3077236 RepID=UPI0028DEAEAD|nr:hypothetical protein [Curvibacter sp. APW13]MDT8992825.1 hypothetical protein [Curvibacter sp. APW13]
MIYSILADGNKVGITTAPCEALALRQALRALSRPTNSKDSDFPDYTNVCVVPFTAVTPAPANVHVRHTCGATRPHDDHRALPLRPFEVGAKYRSGVVCGPAGRKGQPAAQPA